jgi:general L-amino acid transport system permease protein
LTSARVPFWRDVKKLSVLLQVLTAVGALGFAALLILTAFRGMVARGIPFTFAFLTAEAGFTISEGSLLTFEDGRLTWRSFQPTDLYLSAFVTGLVNTLRVAVIGIAAATLLGVTLGVSRLSINGLLRNLSFAYVELVRNTPLLLQMFFWYFAVFLNLPPARDASRWYGGLIVSNQGAFIPWPRASESPASFTIALLVAALLASIAYVVSRKSRFAAAYATATLIAAAAIGVGISGIPFELSYPEMQRFRITGGATLSPEFTAVLLALVIYTSAFIAEVIRGAIQSIHKGQTEAARSLGLSQGQTMRLVVLPQAIRIVIPPIGNLYLSLMKNTSLAVAVGYPDLFNVYRTIGNQSGRSLEGVVIVMIIYLVLSLAISGAINAYNRKVMRSWGG